MIPAAADQVVADLPEGSALAEVAAIASRPRGAALVRWYATWFGTGYAPTAPATVATIAALPLYFVLVYLPSALQLAIIVAMVIAGIFAADRVARDMGAHDPQIVVIDESASILLALWIAAPQGWFSVVTVTGLFRLLDIFKPGPIRTAERLRPAGLGIMADDVLAALVAGLITRLLLH